METSSEIKNIAKALKEWHELAITVTKDATNPHFRSRFTSLDNMIETIRLPLASCGLSFAQLPDGDGLTTILMHTSGEWLKSTANLKLAKEDPQGQGSAYTYGRRYALSAMLGLAADEDDDGNAATAARNAVQKPATATTHPQATTGRHLAAKDRTRTLLKLLGHHCKTKAEYENTVFDLTDLVLTDENLDAVNKKLSALLEAKEAQA